MSGHGAPDLAVDATGAKVAIIASRWHTEVMDGLIAGAERALEDAHVTDVTFVRAPGSFELPILAQAYAKQGFDAVVALDTGVPVGFGLLTCDNDEQALDRAGLPDSHEDKGREATEAALATWSVLRTLS